MSENTNIQYQLGMILTELKNINRRLEKMEEEQEKHADRTSLLEKGWYKATGVAAAVSFFFTMTGTWLWDKVIK